MSKRVVFYINGFNLYFGIRENNWQRYYWLDIEKLAKAFVLKDDQLVDVKYFTARVSSPQDQVGRQSTYLDALSSCTNTRIIYGQFKSQKKRGNACRQWFYNSSEKKTDVNIATEMLTDTFQDKFDKAYLVSGDSDLVPPILKIRELFPSKIVNVVFPPKRFTEELKLATHSSLYIKKRNLRRALLENPSISKSGQYYNKPIEWA
jgi:uncharacterized LabA/DUF88 family protein